ncbi:hypothetical protein ACRAQ7_05810 [Erythrobacter sp. W53]|uniref:hypothetical protein n=1 Tax=Erythrobacter sp. W53 TaxID=3425947 RepID=UPI003D767E8F
MPNLTFGIAAAAVLALVPPLAQPLAAQETDPQAASPEERIDILIEPPADQRLVELCDEEQEAAILSGEIIVCREITDDSSYRYSDDYNSDTRSRQEQIDNFGLPKGLPADFAGPGIFRGPATAGGGCLPGSCPPPMPELIDLKAIPEAPPGSDADRVGRGLPPLGNDEGTPLSPPIAKLRDPMAAPPPQIAPEPDEQERITEAELALPPKPDFETAD